MRDQYLPPQLTQVGSVKDLTLATGTGTLIDVCITIGGGQIQSAVSVLDGPGCFAVAS